MNKTVGALFRIVLQITMDEKKTRFEKKKKTRIRWKTDNRMFSWTHKKAAEQIEM